MKKNYKSNRQVVYSCKYHIIWCPKYRRKILENKIASRLEELILEIIEEKKAELFELEIMPDHVHLLVEIDPQYGIHKLVKAIKGRSSRILRQEFPIKRRLPTLWSHSYFVATVGGAPLNIVKKYIEEQKYV
jgi:putative transposase